MLLKYSHISTFSLQFSSVAQSCPTVCNPMDCSTPGFPVHHQFPELTQTHVHRISDAIQPSHPLSSPSPTFNLSQHQGLFKCVSSSQGQRSLFIISSDCLRERNRPIENVAGLSRVICHREGFIFLSSPLVTRSVRRRLSGSLCARRSSTTSGVPPSSRE